MAMTHKTRKRLALLILMVGLPLYIAVMVGVLGLFYDRFGQPPLLVELGVYIVLGTLCFLPLKPIFLGTAQEDPEGPKDGAGSDH